MIKRLVILQDEQTRHRRDRAEHAAGRGRRPCRPRPSRRRRRQRWRLDRSTPAPGGSRTPTASAGDDRAGGAAPSNRPRPPAVRWRRSRKAASMKAERALIEKTLHAGALESPQGLADSRRELQDAAQQDQGVRHHAGLSGSSTRGRYSESAHSQVPNSKSTCMSATRQRSSREDQDPPRPHRRRRSRLRRPAARRRARQGGIPRDRHRPRRAEDRGDQRRPLLHPRRLDRRRPGPARQRQARRDDRLLRRRGARHDQHLRADAAAQDEGPRHVLHRLGGGGDRRGTCTRAC